MRPFAAFLAILLALAGCATRLSPFGIAETNIPLNTSDFGKEEASFLAHHPDLAKRNGKLLTLTFPGGPSIDLTNTDEEDHPEIGDDANLAYSVIGYWPDRRMFLIDILYWEGYEVALVDNYDTVTNLINRPHFSPNRKFFATYNEGCDMMPPEVEIWNVAQQKPERLYNDMVPSAMTQGPGIHKLVWETDDRIRVETYDCRFYNSGKKDTVEYFLRRQPNGAWTWAGH